MHAAYLNTAAPEPFKVLGKRLLNFTIGHQLLLERFDSCFAVASKKRDPGIEELYNDLLFSVWICSRSYASALDGLTHPLTPIRLKLWAWRCGNFDFAETLGYFTKYIEAHSAEPEWWKGKNWTEDGGSEMSLGVFLKLRTQEAQKLSDRDVLDFPFLQANLLHFRELQKNNIVELVSAEDRRLMDAATALGKVRAA